MVADASIWSTSRIHGSGSAGLDKVDLTAFRAQQRICQLCSAVCDANLPVPIGAGTEGRWFRDIDRSLKRFLPPVSPLSTVSSMLLSSPFRVKRSRGLATGTGRETKKGKTILYEHVFLARRIYRSSRS